MAVNFSDFYESAKLVVEDVDSTEMALRNSMSRAYYALYHVALSYADSVSIPPVSALGGGSTHQKLADFYTANGTQDKDLKLKLRSIGYVLKQNHQARCRADYHLDESVEFDEAKIHLKSCQNLIHKVCDLMA